MTDQARPPTSDVNDLLGAFALDAVDAEERAQVEQLLAADPTARAEVDEMRETASVLASLPRDDEGAPDGLWDRISSAIEEPVTRSAGDAEIAPVIPITRAQRFAAVPARVFLPVAAAAAIIIAVLTVQLTTRPPGNAGNVAAAYNHAVQNGATKVDLTATGGGVAAEIALKSDGTGYLRNDNLDALPPDQTYQLWALVKQGDTVRAISAGVLGSDPDAIAFHVASRPDSFAITVEAAPGVVSSRQSPVATGGGVQA